jgi:hypothetical protein
MIPAHNSLKHGDALSSLLFNSPLEDAFRKIKENQVEIEMGPEETQILSK